MNASHKHLHQIIEEYQVVYEHWPTKVVREGGQFPVGHDVVLIGTHSGHPKDMPTPGCPRCVKVWRNLEELAHAVAPPPTSLSRSRIVPFSRAVHYARERDRPDIELILEIRHRSDYNAPVDACEDRCLNIVLGQLRQLGVAERQWHKGTA